MRRGVFRQCDVAQSRSLAWPGPRGGRPDMARADPARSDETCDDWGMGVGTPQASAARHGARG
eukprot:223684-Prymnesium_polylepis.2